jgi:Sec-independent protein secretion pathway component TatC
MMILVFLFFLVFFGLAIYLTRVLDRREEKKMQNKRQRRS